MSDYSDGLNLDAVEDFSIILTSSAGRQINLLGQMLSLSIYQSIFNSLMMCEVVVFDAIALFHDLPIIGEETLDVEFRTNNTKKISKYTFHIHALEDGAYGDMNKHRMYKLRGTSVEGITDAQTLVQETYTSPIHQMVNNLVKSHLSSKKTLITASSEGAQKINIPSMSPLKAIEMLRQQAVSGSFKYSPYVFFENPTGFHFVDITSQFQQARVNVESDMETLKRIFYPTNTDLTNTVSKNSWKNIVALETVTSHDTLSKTHTGTFFSKLQKYDLLTKKYEEIDTKLSSLYKSMDVIKTKSTGYNTSDFVSRMSAQGAVQYLMFTDADRPKIPVEFLPQKSAFSVLLFQNITNVEFHGDSTLEAGGVVYIDVRRSSGMTDNPSDDSDKFNSGFYFISKLAHHITLASGSPSMRTSCEIVKGSNLASERDLQGSL